MAPFHLVTLSLARIPCHSDKPRVNQGLKAENVAADAVAEEAEAFAGAFFASAYTDMIESSKAEFVHREGAAADVTWNFAENVECRLLPILDCENAEAIFVGGTNQANRALSAGWFSHGDDCCGAHRQKCLCHPTTKL